MTLTLNSQELETIIIPAIAEQKLIRLYRLIEAFYRVKYDKYSYDVDLVLRKERGIFGNKSSLERTINEISEEKIKQNYFQSRENPLKFLLANEEIHYGIQELDIPSNKILKKDEKYYLVCEHSANFNFQAEHIEIIF